MVQRVYGRPDPGVLGALLRRQMGLPGGTAAAPGDPPAETAENKGDGPGPTAAWTAADMQQTGRTGGDTVDNPDAPRNAKAPDFRGLLVGHDRLELSANGLRVRATAWPAPGKTSRSRAPREGTAANMQQTSAKTPKELGPVEPRRRRK